jgi:ATP-binding cassette subfamily B protein
LDVHFAFSGNESSTGFYLYGFFTALIAFNPWLILLLVLAIIPSFLGESYFNSKNYALSRSQTQKEENWITCVGS